MIKYNDYEVEFKSYPNGETRFELPQEHLDSWHRYNYPRVKMNYENDQDLIHLMLLKNYLADQGIEKVTLRLSHMPYARMDRAPDDVPFTLKYVCDFINALDFHHIEVVDPHSDVCVALLDGAREISAIEQLVERARDEIGVPVSLVFPDAGAQKKYERLLKPGEDYYFGIKHRNFSNGQIEGIQVFCSDSGAEAYESVSTRPALIVDDLCSRGGTFIGTAEALRKQWGFESVYLTVAHCEQAAWYGDLWKAVGHVYTTDSMPETWNDYAEDEHVAWDDWITRYNQDELLKEAGE